MELGTGFMGVPMPTMRSFNSKAEAIQFAIEFTASSSMGGRKVELEAALRLALGAFADFGWFAPRQQA